MIRNMAGVPVTTNVVNRGDGECVQVVLAPWSITAFEEWLDARNCVLAQIPLDSDDDLPTYIITPRSMR